jgi:thymidylate synthase (FAD)
MLKDPSVILFSYTKDVEKVCAAAMRSCYSTRSAFELYKKRTEGNGEALLTKGRVRELIQRALRLGHESVLEHGLLTFDLQGVSRTCTHQLVRHRIASFSQQSQRHVRVDSSTDWYMIPPALDADSRRKFEERMRTVASWYAEDTKKGRRIEDARFYLPNATRTNITVSMNPRELLHVFRLRCCAAAQWEIRAVAWAMLACSRIVAPNIFETISQGKTDKYVEERETRLKRILVELWSRFEEAQLGETVQIPLADLDLGANIEALISKC